jgi:hypothetical protein
VVRGRFDPDHFVAIRLFRLDPLGIGRQSDGNGEDNDSLHAQVSAESCRMPKKVSAKLSHYRWLSYQQANNYVAVHPTRDHCFNFAGLDQLDTRPES